jgi:hypothetical protein
MTSYHGGKLKIGKKIAKVIATQVMYLIVINFTNGVE